MRTLVAVAIAAGALGFVTSGRAAPAYAMDVAATARDLAHDRSAPLSQTPAPRPAGAPSEAPHSPAGAKVEQTTIGKRPPLDALASFDGLGSGFAGPQGAAARNNPSDNSRAVGPNHVV